MSGETSKAIRRAVTSYLAGADPHKMRPTEEDSFSALETAASWFREAIKEEVAIFATVLAEELEL